MRKDYGICEVVRLKLVEENNWRGKIGGVKVDVYAAASASASASALGALDKALSYLSLR